VRVSDQHDRIEALRVGLGNCSPFSIRGRLGFLESAAGRRQRGGSRFAPFQSADGRRLRMCSKVKRPRVAPGAPNPGRRRPRSPDPADSAVAHLVVNGADAPPNLRSARSHGQRNHALPQRRGLAIQAPEWCDAVHHLILDSPGQCRSVPPGGRRRRSWESPSGYSSDTWTCCPSASTAVSTLSAFPRHVLLAMTSAISPPGTSAGGASGRCLRKE